MNHWAILERNPSQARDVWFGVESEYLRLTPEGELSLKPHPFGEDQGEFHKDFSESQLELVSPPAHGALKAHRAIEELHGRASSMADAMGERLWAPSIPPRSALKGPIPLAQFPGKSQDQLYRRGLLSRYGGARQLISGVHLNMSMGKHLLKSLESRLDLTREELYLKACRFVLSHLDILLLLTGASPWGLDPRQVHPQLSARNGSQGYPQQLDYIDFSNLDSYLEGIRRGLEDIHPDFQKLGLFKDGEWVQRSNRHFQSEKEFYSPIRLKQLSRLGESQLKALRTKGIAYVEFRFLDKDPLVRGGISPECLALFHMTFLKGLLTQEESPFPWREGMLRGRAAADEPLAKIIKDRDLFRRTENFLRDLGELPGILDQKKQRALFTQSLQHYLAVARGDTPLLSQKSLTHHRAQSLEPVQEVFSHAV